MTESPRAEVEDDDIAVISLKPVPEAECDDLQDEGTKYKEGDETMTHVGHVVFWLQLIAVLTPIRIVMVIMAISVMVMMMMMMMIKDDDDIADDQIYST